MFKAGDFVVYGSNGVCRVQKVGTLDSPGVPKDRLYYTLIPCYIKGSTIFTPVDNQKVIIRLVLTREEALQLIDEISCIDMLWYKEAFRSCDCRELVKIIKTIYLRKQSRIAEGKKVTTQDDKYFHMAEDALYGELAVALGFTREETKKFVIDRVKQLEVQEG